MKRCAALWAPPGGVTCAVLFLVILGVSSRAQDTAAPEEPATDAGQMLVVPKAEDRKVEGVPEPTPEPADAASADDAVADDAASAKEATTPAEPESDVVPDPFPLSRYATLWERSPFQLESIAPPTESVGLSQRFALTGIAQIDGEPIAFLMERASQQRLMIDKKTNNVGISLVQVDLQPKQADSSVTLRSGGEVGVVKFDDTVATSPPMVPPPNAMGAAPNVPGVRAVAQNAAVPPPFVQGQQQGQVQQQQFAPNGVNPGVPGVVPGVPGPPVPQPGAPGQQVVIPNPNQQQMPPPRVIRRRAIIPSAP